MNKSELFKAAHKLAKDIIQKGDNYHATFGLCLKYVRENGLPTDTNCIFALVVSNLLASPAFARFGRVTFGNVQFALRDLGEDESLSRDMKFCRKLLSYVHPDRSTGNLALSQSLNRSFKTIKGNLK